MAAKYDIQIPAAHMTMFMESGLWPNRLITDYFDDVVTATPARAAVVGYTGQTDEPVRLSYGELHRRAVGVTAALAPK